MGGVEDEGVEEGVGKLLVRVVVGRSDVVEDLEDLLCWGGVVVINGVGVMD